MTGGTVYYKCLTAKGRGPYSGKKWSLPTKLDDGTYKPGRWMPRINGDIEKCKIGYHGCTEDQLVRWLNHSIYVMEYDGDVESDEEKCWGRRARLLYPLTNWTERTARLFACDCAEHVLPIFEEQHPDDSRPREAITVARRFAVGEATDAELTAAWAAAWAAARDAARDAAWDAARDAAAAAAAWDAARDAAWAAARDAARAAARDAERSWQTTRLFEYLRGER